MRLATTRLRNDARPHTHHRITALPSRLRYDAYKLYKYNHTVPIYIFYATVCDNIDVTVQSRVPLPGLKESMAAAVKAFADAPERAPSEAKLSSLDR